MDNLKYYKAFIRVCKSLTDERFGFDDQIREPLIIAKDKAEVKKILLEKYPQFFQKDKVYEKETKDTAQFFYVVIFELYEHEVREVNEGSWTCSMCNKINENKYIHYPRTNSRLLGNDLLFCNDTCLNKYIKDIYQTNDLEDDICYVTVDSQNYIYKITEKSSNKCYIGKTKNEPFFRWWNHWKHSHTPFGKYFSSTKISDWVFEVLEVLPSNMINSDVLKIESDYILKFDSINNGYNSLISNKKCKIAEELK